MTIAVTGDSSIRRALSLLLPFVVSAQFVLLHTLHMQSYHGSIVCICSVME